MTIKVRKWSTQTSQITLNLTKTSPIKYSKTNPCYQYPESYFLFIFKVFYKAKTFLKGIYVFLVQFTMSFPLSQLYGFLSENNNANV